MPQSSCASQVKKLVAEVDQFNEMRGRTGFVTLKEGSVVKRSEWAPPWIAGTNAFGGKWYPSVARTPIPPRPIFSLNRVRIQGRFHYLELKGYGLEGREMFFNLHVQGDIYYGMFLDEAIREFDRLCQARKAGISVPFPIAVVEISRDEYIEHGLKGFEQVIAARLLWHCRKTPKWLASVAAQDPEFESFDDPYKAYAHSVVHWIKQHPQGIEQAVAIAMRELYNPALPRDALNNNLARSADALLSNRKVGYLIRAARSPIRVGDPTDPSIDTERNRKIALAMGKAFRGLLELGLLHHCPGTGNWTTAGEFTDFQDTFDLATEYKALQAHIAGLPNTQLTDKSLPGFVRYLIGPKHAGKLDPFFLQGICGCETTLACATEEVRKLVLQKLKTR